MKSNGPSNQQIRGPVVPDDLSGMTRVSLIELKSDVLVTIRSIRDQLDEHARDPKTTREWMSRAIKALRIRQEQIQHIELQLHILRQVRREDHEKYYVENISSAHIGFLHAFYRLAKARMGDDEDLRDVWDELIEDADNAVTLGMDTASDCSRCRPVKAA